MLRTLGRQGVDELITRCCDRATEMAERLRAHPTFSILNEVLLNQVLIRVTSPSGANITADVIVRVQQEGVCWVGGTTWNGQPAMRISISNWSTTADDIDRSAASIVSSAR